MKHLILTLLFCATVTAAAAPNFHKDIAPILREYCAGCHNDDELEGEFSVETFKSLMAGGDSGKAIAPGNAKLRRADIDDRAVEVLCTFPRAVVRHVVEELRDSDLEVEEEAEDLVREFETALKRRRRGEVVRLKISAGAPEARRRSIERELHVQDEEVIEGDGFIGISHLCNVVWPENSV